MPEKIVTHGVIVVRDGERVEPPIGKPFDFTDAELKDLAKDNPVPIRDVRDESGGAREAGKGAPATNKAPGNPLAGRQNARPGKAEVDEEL